MHKKRGFIALISVLIISTVLLITVLSLAQFGIASRYFLFDMENKTASERLAEACINVARIMVFNDPATSITTPKEVPVGTKTCQIRSIAQSGSKSTILARGISNKAITNYSAEVTAATGAFLSFEELN